jgi:putative selenium metabolism hydrolase
MTNRFSSKTDELAYAVASLVKAKSYSGDEGVAVAAARKLFEAYGYDEVVVDEYGSISGVIHGNRPGPTVLFDHHIDTVPVPDPSVWTQEPWGGKVVDGKLYGRGTSDMKGALGTALVACADFARENGRRFAGRLVVTGVVYEELFEGIAARSLSARWKPDYVIIGEASELNLKRAQRGRAEVVVETFGVPAHSANPDKGVNAVTKMAQAILAIQALVPGEQPVLGKGILELTDIISTPYPGASVVPSHCRATFDRRLLVGETPESVLAPIQAILDQLAAADPKFQARVSLAEATLKCFTGATIGGQRFFPGWRFDDDAPFVQAALKALRGAGVPAQLSQYSFCTNGSHYAGEAGIKTLGFGPSRENLAHTIDEHVELEHLEAAWRGYQALAQALTELT